MAEALKPITTSLPMSFSFSLSAFSPSALHPLGLPAFQLFSFQSFSLFFHG
jgi:hypothetical protein